MVIIIDLDGYIGANEIAEAAGSTFVLPYLYGIMIPFLIQFIRDND
jgi:hypothetical protein